MDENNEKTGTKGLTMRGKCICQICTCGRHRCPHNRGTLGSSPVKDCTLKTEYQQAFEKLMNQRRREAIRPQQHAHTTKMPMNIETTYHHTYTKLKPQAFIVKPHREYIAPTVKMDKDSTYSKSYVPTNGQRSDSFKPKKKWEPSSATFLKDTMYTDSYKDFGVDQIARCRSKPTKHKESILVDPTPMDALSVMKGDFKRHESPERAKLVRPVSDAMTSTARRQFNAETTYTVEYVEKEGPPVKKATSPDTYVPNPTPFQGETTVMADYQPHPGAKRVQSHKPNLAYVPLPAKFNHITTASDAYKPWPVQKEEKPAWARPATINNGNQPFSKTSSYHEDYVKPAPHERTKLAQPGIDPPLCLGHDSGEQPPLSNLTQYREMYNKLHGFHKPKSFKIHNVYEAPKEAVETKSVYQANYRGKFSTPATLCVPVSNNKDSARRAMLFNTTYHDTFQGECPLVCPAKVIIDAGQEGKGAIEVKPYGQFQKDTLHNGHQFYKIAGPPVTHELFRSFAPQDIGDAMTVNASNVGANKRAHQELVLA